MATPRTHRYQLFGLRVDAELALPEALNDDSALEPDVAVRMEAIDWPPTPSGISAVADGLMLTVPDVARYWIRDGREIIVDAVPGVPDKNVRLYLLGSAMGAVLHQRGLLPLHANVVEIDGRAIAFVGESGAGKSTLAGWFHDRGRRVLSDDVCVIHGIEAGRPLVFPAVRRLRLCRDALLASGRAPEDFEPSYSGDPAFDKFDIPLAPDDATPLPLSAIVLLAFGTRDEVELVGGVEAAEILYAHTYRGGMVDQVGKVELHWQAVTRLLQSIQVLRWSRPRDRAAVQSGAEGLLAVFRRLEGDRADQTPGGEVR
jgi:hypothetical protein